MLDNISEASHHSKGDQEVETIWNAIHSQEKRPYWDFENFLLLRADYEDINEFNDNGRYQDFEYLIDHWINNLDNYYNHYMSVLDNIKVAFAQNKLDDIANNW